MVLEAPLPKTAAGRPPFGGPPIGTTFSNDPDDRDDFLASIRDNVERLVSQAEKSDRASIGTYLRLLDQRRDWVMGEIRVESMFSDVPRAPLGIAENLYDLATLTIEPLEPRRRAYEMLIDRIDRTMALLWERMLETEESGE